MEKSAFIIFLACIVFAVLSFGAIHTWAYTIVFLGVIAGSLLTLRGAVDRTDAASRPGPHLKWIRTDLDPLFLFFIALLLLQMLPLPGSVLLTISPESKISGDMSQPAAAALNPLGIERHWYTLAPYIHPVRMSLVRWTVYGLLFFGLVRCLNSRKRIEAAIATILLLAALDSLYGIMQAYSGYRHIWWFKTDYYGKDVCGTFLNRNLFAGFMETTIMLAVAYAAGLENPDPRRTDPSRGRSFSRRFLAFFSEDPHRLKRFLIIFAGGVMGLGLILSSSRGGIIATTGGLLVLGLFFFFRKGERPKGRIILLLFGIAMLFAVHAGLDYTIGRFQFFDEDMKFRGVMAEKALSLFKDYSFAGTGMGNFSLAYGRYQDPLHKKYYVDFAHNDYAQFLAEAGILGAILLAAGLGWFLVRMFGIWRKRNDPFAVCLGIAPFAALVAAAIHAYSDFNLHRPSHMMVLIAVFAIGTAALHLRPDGRHRSRTQYRQGSVPLYPWGAVLLGCTAAMILWCGVWTLRHFIAETYCNTDLNITMNLEENPPQESIRKAKRWNPSNASYPFKLARALMVVRDERMQGRIRDTEGWRQSHGPIITELELAIRLNPWNAEQHVRLGWEYSYRFDRPDYLDRWLPAADICMDRAAHFAGSWPQFPRLHYDIGNYWIMRSNSFGPNDPKRDITRTKATWHYRQAMELEQVKELPQDVRTYIGYFFRGDLLSYDLSGSARRAPSKTFH